MPLKVIPRRDRKLNRVLKRGVLRDLNRGERLFGAGEAAGELFLVRTGHIRLLSVDSSGAGKASRSANRGKVVGIAGPWELCGEEALLSDASRRCDGVAGEPCQLLVLNARGAQKALQTSPQTFEAFLRAKEAELALARALSALRRPGGAKARLGALLLDLGTRLGEKEEKGPGKGLRIPIALTHQVLADLSDAHRSTVTTLLNDWIYEGVLKTEGRGIKIVKPKALERG